LSDASEMHQEACLSAGTDLPAHIKSRGRHLTHWFSSQLQGEDQLQGEGETKTSFSKEVSQTSAFR